MIDNSLVADIYENDQPNAEIEEDEVEIEVPDFVSVGLGGCEDGFSPIVSISKTGKVTTLEITDKNGKQTAKILDGKDGAQWYFTYVYDAVLQYGNDGDLSVDLSSPNLPVYKVDKANNQMVFTGAYLKGEKGDPYTLTQDDRNMIVNDVIAALPVYGGEVESV